MQHNDLETKYNAVPHIQYIRKKKTITNHNEYYATISENLNICISLTQSYPK